MAQYQFFISTDLQFLDYTKGRPVLYSEVKEIEPDNSYIIYKYSNSDNLNYRDESPLNIYTFFFGEYFTGASENDRKAASSNSNPFLSPTSRDLERGLLLSKEVHNASGTLLTNTVNTYNSDPNRFNSYVRSFNNYLLQPNLGAVTAIEYYFQAYKIYTYFPYLAQRVEYTYDQQNPLATPVTKTTNYTYDPVTMLLTQKTTTDSRGGVISDTYKHPTDFSGTAIYNTMVSNNMLAPVVETDEQVGGALTKKSFTNFQSWTASSATIIAPVSMQQQVLTNPTETLMEFNSYDGYGNVKEEQKPGDARHAYIWDYQSDYPVAQAVNASASDIAYTSFEADGTGNWQGVNVSAIQYPNATSPPTGRNYYNLVTGNTISSATLNSQVQYLVSYWSNNGQCTVSNTQSVKVVSTINGWTYYEHLIATGATSVAISFSGTCGIDELRLYPANALMTTYTYSPLVGMTSKCDPSGRITYYAYDGVNRLKTIRDQNGNIIKEICYSVGGLPDNCSETVSYNDPQSGTYYSHSCQPYYVAQPYVYAVKSRSYFSLISPADANQQAMNDVTANGQNMANQYGACSPPPMLNITYYNYSTAAATLRLTNTVTNAVYSFSLNANQTASMATAGQIPAGSYNVTLMRNRGSQTGTVEFDGYIQTNVSTLTLTGISITAENDPMAIVN
jgi:YD repeat-containing protein